MLMTFGDYYSDYLKPFAISDEYSLSQNDKKIIKIEKNNPLCGDKVTLYFLQDKQGKVTEISNHVEGCRLIQASANILCHTIMHKTVEEIKVITQVLEQKIFSDQKITISKNMQPWQYLWLSNEFPARLKCIWLPWELLYDYLS